MDDHMKQQKDDGPDHENTKGDDLEVTDLIDDSEFEEIIEDGDDNLDDVIPADEVEPVDDDSEEPFEDDEAVEGEYEGLDENLSSSAVMAAASAGAATKSIGRSVFEWVECIAIALIIALLLKTFVFTLVRVDGPSMNPTLTNNDRLFVWELMYDPQPGDIIIFRPHENDRKTHYVKRVIATSGQTVDIDFKTGLVMVDGKVLDEPYIADLTHLKGDMIFPQTVPEDSVFAMGDNRNKSHDSRFSDVGFVKKSAIDGKAMFRIWPLTDIGGLYDYGDEVK